jgi:hypothetical protein
MATATVSDPIAEARGLVEKSTEATAEVDGGSLGGSFPPDPG